MGRRRSVRLRCIDHRWVRAAAVAIGAAGAADDGAATRRGRCVTANRAVSTAPNDRALASGNGRAMLGGRETAVDGAATSERDAFLAEDVAVRPGAGSPGRRTAAGSGPHDAVAHSAGHCALGANVGRGSSPTRDRRLRGRVATKRGAVAAQQVAAAATTDA